MVVLLLTHKETYDDKHSWVLLREALSLGAFLSAMRPSWAARVP